MDQLTSAFTFLPSRSTPNRWSFRLSSAFCTSVAVCTCSFSLCSFLDNSNLGEMSGSLVLLTSSCAFFLESFSCCVSILFCTGSLGSNLGAGDSNKSTFLRKDCFYIYLSYYSCSSWFILKPFSPSLSDFMTAIFYSRF